MVVRIGVEAAGHYPRTLGGCKQPVLEVVELNPRAVKDARGQQLLRTLKNDARDCGAMAELLIPGSGRSPQCRDEALAGQAAWVAHRRRKVAAQVVLANQIHGQLDLIFPGLTGCFSWPTLGDGRKRDRAEHQVSRTISGPSAKVHQEIDSIGYFAVAKHTSPFRCRRSTYAVPQRDDRLVEFSGWRHRNRHHAAGARRTTRCRPRSTRP